MAGEWIKVELSTADKPEILRMARLLSIDKDAVFGKLIRLWAWFDKNSVDGVVDGVVDADVDSLCHQKGFTVALVSVGWLVVDKDAERVTIPKFDRHNGESAKKRILKNERQSRWRQNKEQNVDAPVSTQASTREEKRRINTKRETPASKKSPIPENWTPKLETVERLTGEFGFINGDAERYIDAFRDACKAKGYEYIDFDAAFANCVRKDWPGLRHGAPRMPKHESTRPRLS